MHEKVTKIALRFGLVKHRCADALCLCSFPLEFDLRSANILLWCVLAGSVYALVYILLQEHKCCLCN